MSQTPRFPTLVMGQLMGQGQSGVTACVGARAGSIPAGVGTGPGPSQSPPHSPTPHESGHLGQSWTPDQRATTRVSPYRNGRMMGTAGHF